MEEWRYPPFVRKGVQNWKHFLTYCFWCKKRLEIRYDAFKRQMVNYGHTCCKKCFGKEPSFRKAQKNRTDNRSRPHTEETKRKLSLSKIGNTPWNKGLNKSDERVLKYSEACRATKIKNPSYGNKNSNWKGGIAAIPKQFPNSAEFKRWMRFRSERIKEDFGQCYKCSQRFFSNQLDVHHLASRKKFPELQYDPFNCVLLCKKCHREFHKKFGVKNFTPWQWKDWINSGREIHQQFKFD